MKKMHILKTKRRKVMGKRHVVWSSIIIFLYLISPIYGKTEGFKEVSKKKYDADIWHTYEHTASGLEVIWIENDDTNKAFVDHCHDTKKVRGLLCAKCNTLLGMAKDDVSILQNAITYLTS